MGMSNLSTSSHDSPTGNNWDSQESTPNAETGNFPHHPSSDTSDLDIGVGSESEDDEETAEEILLEPPSSSVEGWPQLATLMDKTPDFAAFSRFRDLNIKSLLYYQSQLTVLRNKLRKLEYVDSRRTKGMKARFATRADFLMDYKESRQFKVIKEIREVLKEYNDALLQYSNISALPDPDAYNMDSLGKWLRNEQLGNYKIGGEGEQYTWDTLVPKDDTITASKLWKQFGKLCWAFIWPAPPPSNKVDLVSTGPRSKTDGFTLWVLWHLFPFLEACRQYRAKKKQTDNEAQLPHATDTRSSPKKNTSNSDTKRPKQPNEWDKDVKKFKTVETWESSTALRITSSISTIIACLLPVVAITVLSQIKGTRNLLLCLAGFAVIFAIGLIFLTSGTTTRVEIFMATAAFSAVLVVFISEPIIVFTPVGSSVAGS